MTTREMMNDIYIKLIKERKNDTHIGQVTGVSQQMVHMWKTGKQKIPEKHFDALYNFFYDYNQKVNKYLDIVGKKTDN